MRIGELSKITGVSIPTIRLYEKEGLIGPASRTQGRLREFSPEQEIRLNFIKRVRNLGFSLDDVKALLDLSGNAEENKRRNILQSIRSGIKTRRDDLARLERFVDADGQSVGPLAIWNER